MRLGVYFEEFEATGERCVNCREVIIGKAFIPMVQVGDPDNAISLECFLCVYCMGDETGTKPGDLPNELE